MYSARVNGIIPNNMGQIHEGETIEFRRSPHLEAWLGAGRAEEVRLAGTEILEWSKRVLGLDLSGMDLTIKRFSPPEDEWRTFVVSAEENLDGLKVEMWVTGTLGPDFRFVGGWDYLLKALSLSIPVGGEILMAEGLWNEMDQAPIGYRVSMGSFRGNMWEDRNWSGVIDDVVDHLAKLTGRRDPNQFRLMNYRVVINAMKDLAGGDMGRVLANKGNEAVVK